MLNIIDFICWFQSFLSFQLSIPGKQLYICELCETNQNVKSDNNYDDPIESSVNEQLSTKVEITVARGITIKGTFCFNL
jgi:hypothetical protein